MGLARTDFRLSGAADGWGGIQLEIWDEEHDELVMCVYAAWDTDRLNVREAVRAARQELVESVRVNGGYEVADREMLAVCRKAADREAAGGADKFDD